LKITEVEKVERRGEKRRTCAEEGADGDGKGRSADRAKTAMGVPPRNAASGGRQEFRT